MNIVEQGKEKEKGDKLCIGVNEVAELCGVCINTARRITRMPGCPILKVGRRTLIPAKAFEEWLSKSVVKSW
jgi:hypothetical protein